MRPQLARLYSGIFGKLCPIKSGTMRKLLPTSITLLLVLTEWGVGLTLPGERSSAPVVVSLPAALPLLAGALFSAGLTRRRVG